MSALSSSSSCDAPLSGAKILGVFSGAEQHNFCLAMEDLSVEFDGLDAAGLDAGWSKEEALIRAREAAGMHAYFWRSPTLEEEWLNNEAKGHAALKDGTLIPVIIGAARPDCLLLPAQSLRCQAARRV